jgi:predicted metal-dependent hydrolase
MSQKNFTLEGLGLVTIQKNRNSKSMRLSITHDGRIRVSQPYWVPYQSGLSFAATQRAWIASNQPPTLALLTSNQQIGKQHRLYFVPDGIGTSSTLRISDNKIEVFVPRTKQISDIDIQSSAKTACLEALRRQSKALLTNRTAELAQEHGFKYKQVRIKSLKSRWGSCSRAGIINYNLYLIQLPWELIDYVILHELSHTKFMSHDKKFWDELGSHVADPKAYRKRIRKYRPILSPEAT